ncbi:biotin--[acetyl-CoA-carboxylase] ligase [Sphingomonas xanthus]|uniref:biotin--[acetyl-CoA-carboxylase] ligase n=1 Tax=Sphingomonas xanthus TaxID=2594473 RepID=UPI002482ACD6|nr:biotin--[acetyl-CoA-carboxylase] ligase [Sphingomonas xanthus]
MVDRLGSTNTALLADRLAVEGDWLIALRQDAGRGRHGRTWESVEGNFFGSTLVQLRDDDPPAPALALLAGLALIEAVEVAAPGTPLSLKWPNDLMLGDAKLAGILLERAGDRVVAGFGVNLAGAPKIAGRKTAALAPTATIAPQAFAPLLAGKFAQLLTVWRSADPAQFAQAWQARAHPIGTPLEVHSGPGERVLGTFDGIEADGAMRLRKAGGEVDVIRAGDVLLG